MKKRFIALGSYSIFWFCFFIFARLFFILFQHQLSFPNNAGELLATFWHGSKLDISTTGYYLLIPVLAAIPGILLNGSWFQILVRWYTYILIVFSTVIMVSDANLYSYWGFRMDYTPMFYLKTPGEAMASVSTLQIILFIAVIVVISAFFIFIYNKLIDRLLSGFDRERRPFIWIPAFLVLLASLIIPIRGGFGIAPINAGTVYFSQKMFLNHAAINAVWNVGTSAFTQKPVKNPYSFGDPVEAAKLVDSLAAKKGIPRKVISIERPNVMIIILESFSGFLIGELGGDSLVTPNFNRYAREGILFTNFYASGTRTDKAIPAVMDGYPALPALSVIKEPKKSQSLPNIVKMLIERGYNSSFWYGGEINFANFNSFVIGSGFRQIMTKSNFNPRDYNSKWGVHDHVMFTTLADSMKKFREPFVSVVLTLSSHEPFDVPMEPVFTGDSKIAKYKNSVCYADRALGAFLDQAQKSDWWKNTIIIMVADHCARVASEIPIYSKEAFKIPMVWTGGALTGIPIRVSKYGSQTDIPVTLAAQLGMPQPFPFGKDLLSPESASFAFYTFNEGFGFIDDSSAVAYDQKLKKPVMLEGKNTAYALNAGKSFLQDLFDDYLKR
jgi:phosphoglycerol transferase MdoB-like AlkP superfamily enzyme